MARFSRWLIRMRAALSGDGLLLAPEGDGDQQEEGGGEQAQGVGHVPDYNLEIGQYPP